jgi:hypothetical protein
MRPHLWVEVGSAARYSRAMPAPSPSPVPGALSLTDAELGILVAGLALGGVIIGALVAGGFALLTGWLESRRERARWIREETFRAVIDLRSAATLIAQADKPDMAALVQRLADAQSRIGLFADEDFMASVVPLLDHAVAKRKQGAEKPTQAIEEAQRLYDNGARAFLKIPGRWEEG